MENYLFHFKVLIAPLDWGLGHASRCIPLIKHFHKRGCKVIIASDQKQLFLLKNEFPDLETVQLKGYNVNYTKHKRFLVLKILWQIPKIALRIKKEHMDLEKIIAEHRIDLVISDNRYGLYTKKVPCIFITHQLHVIAPVKWVQNLIRIINYRFINRFDECWIPDFEGQKNLAGLLSHPSELPSTTTKYMGPLSRFSRMARKKYLCKYLFVLSGPEPQRSILEKKILEIINDLHGDKLIIRGLPGTIDNMITSSSYIVKNHLTTSEMQNAFLESEYIISRSGYTTVMELLSLGKKSVLLPTPGQTEQEYLAKHLMQQQWCYSCNQDDDLLYHIQRAEKFGFAIPEFDEPCYGKVIDDFLSSLSK